MNLPDLIDLDQQLRLASDEGGRAAGRRLERDRRIARELQAASAGPGGDEQLLRAWTRNVSGTSGPSLGVMLAGAVRWSALVLVVLGLLSGATAAAALLHYDGTQPINVLFFLGVVVGGQLLLLPLLVLTFLFRRRFQHGFKMGTGLIGVLMKQMLIWLARLGGTHEDASKIKADLGALRATNSLFARVQPLLALALLQVFGVAFNLAVAGTLVFLVLFTDLTFSWGTTLEVEPERIHVITSVLSLPWADYLPQARPTLELVENTRFARFEGAFVATEAGAAFRAGGWWPFLLASTLTYGLMPRMIALGVGLYLLRREIGRALARSEEVETLRERLRNPIVWVDPGEVKEPVGPAGRSEPAAAAESVVERDLDVAVIFWAYDEAPPAEVVERLLAQAMGVKVRSQILADGIDATEQKALEQVREARSQGNVGGAVVFFEPFEPPKKDARRFLARLREVLGKSVPMVVLLAEFDADGVHAAEPGEWASWNDAVRGSGDPFMMMQERGLSSGTRS